MRQKGKLRSWDDQKGFGFIEPVNGGKDVFLHISAFSNPKRRPATDQIVIYTLSTDAQGRPRASKAALPGDRILRKKQKSGKAGAIIPASGFFCLLVFSVFFAKLPALVLGVYLVASLITYLAYALDKVAAKDGAWRTKEATLHWLSLIGGWPGALVAQQTLRHKSKKESFRAVFWVTVLVNVSVLGWMFTPAGAETVQSWIGGGQGPIFSQRATIEWTEPRE